MSSRPDTDDATEAPPLAFAVTGGGEPTAEELAAIAVALSPGPGGDGEAERGGPGWSAWREAARMEGVGFRPFVSVDDVARYHRSLA